MTHERHAGARRKVAAPPTRHARIMRGVIAPVFGLLAMAFVALGLLNATVWRPISSVTAAADDLGTRYVITDPGMLSLVDDSVRLKVTSTSASSRVCVALGTAKDVNGWVAGETVTRITGMDGWSTLTTAESSVSSGSASASSSVSFKDSDMWSAVRCAKGDVTLPSSDAAGQVALVDLGSSSVPATVSLHWTRRTLPDFVTPMYFLAGLCAALTVLFASVFAMHPARRRHRHPARRVARRHDEVAIVEALLGSLRALSGSRRRRPRRGARLHAATSEEQESRRATHRRRPVVVDPSSRSMLGAPSRGAHRAQTPVGGGDGEQTSVISPEELADYFSRFAGENGSGDDGGVGTDGVRRSQGGDGR
ncbi:hypothetical protein [uncultured Bifidobacterium sp.]|uniref:hypothetical protein n=1 Tax=uncultured Bifidobacterium sp. TaxID=165187 RepID=UPI0028DC8B85|nr:hypothetical protein [uncultured Bifidobacterium sp.]